MYHLTLEAREALATAHVEEFGDAAQPGASTGPDGLTPAESAYNARCLQAITRCPEYFDLPADYDEDDMFGGGDLAAVHTAPDECVVILCADYQGLTHLL